MKLTILHSVFKPNIFTLFFVMMFFISGQMAWSQVCGAPQTWSPVVQTDLDSVMDESPNLEFVSIAPPPQRCWVGHSPYLVPNPDGNGWDMLMPYYSSYGGSGEIIIHDFGNNETTRQVWGDNQGDKITGYYTDFHMQPAFYTNKKLGFYVWAKGEGLNGLALMFLIYDPAVNKFTHVDIPNPPGLATNVEGGTFDMNEDGMIYGIGWDEMNNGYVPVSLNVKTSEAIAYDKIDPYTGSFTVNYRECKSVGDWAYAAIGNKPWRLVAYNFVSGEGKVLAEANVTGDYNTIKMRKVISNGQRGVTGTIQNASWVNGIGNSNINEYNFWIFDGAIYERTDDNTPWSEKPAQDASTPEFNWDREGQVWKENFIPPAIPLEQVAHSPSDVRVTVADAALSVNNQGEAGWNMVIDSLALGGSAIQADPSIGESNDNGVATIDVAFTESGTYYLYYRAKTSDTDDNGSTGNNDTPRFSRGDTGTPWPSNTQRASHQVRSLTYEWEKAWKSEYGEAFVYTIGAKDVGISHKFKIETFDAGVTIDQILFSKDSSLNFSQIPVFAWDQGEPNTSGHVEFPYHIKGTAVQDTLKYDVKMYNGMVRNVMEINDSVIVATDEGYGQTVFYHLSNGGVTRIDGKLSPSSMAVDRKEQKLYISGYPNSQMYIYDLTREFGHRLIPPNPEFAGYLGVYDDGGNTHCPLGTEIGADHSIYNAGTTYGRTRDGGGMGWYNTRTGEVNGFYQPEFENYRVFWTATANQGRYILLSTKPTVAGDVGKIYCWDTRIQDFAYNITPPGIFVPGPIVEALPGLMIGFTKTSLDGVGRLYGFNAETGDILWTKDVPANPITAISKVRRHAYSFRRGPDNHIWAFLDNVLVRIDPCNIEIQVIGKAEPAQLAFAMGNVYIAGKNSLRLIKDVHVEHDTSTAVDADETFNRIKIYPNPTNGKVYFELNEESIQQIKIFNMNGELIVKKTPTQKNETINLLGFGNGLYVIQLFNSEGVIVSKIIKK